MDIRASDRVCHFDDNVPNAYYVGRAMPYRVGSRLGNPYRIGKAGTRAAVIAKYRDWITANIDDPDVVAELIACRSRPLMCWCRHVGETPTPDNACHADVIAEIHDTFTDAELRALATSPRVPAATGDSEGKEA